MHGGTEKRAVGGVLSVSLWSFTVAPDTMLPSSYHYVKNDGVKEASSK